MEEVEGHVHDDSCYQSEFEYGLICGKEESEPTEGHEHNEDCYKSEEPICGKEEHTHSRECYSNKEDVEDPKDWEEAYKDINKEEDAKTRILTVAKNEVGYKENEANFTVDENDAEHYYTRYGHLYEDMYGDWNNYFTGYVLKYANVKMNFDKDISKWQNKTIDDQKEEGEEGNVVFFRDDEGELRSGIVTKVDDLTKDIRVIEGDVNGEVKEERINKDKVIAYLSDEVTIEDEDTPLAGDGVEKEDKITQTAKDAEETVEVTAEYTKDADIPEEAEFRVKYLETLEDGSIRYDVGFWCLDENAQGEWKEIEPKSEVNISLRYLKNQFEKNDVEKIIHDLPDGSTEDIPVEMKSFNDGTTESTFVMNSFSTITVKKARSSITITPKEGNVLAPGVNINMFNYDSSVNETLKGSFPFRVKEPNQDTENKVKEGLGYKDVEPTAVNLKNGYPVITSKAGTANLEPIFSTTNQYYKGTAVGGGYLFSKDADGYYEYDSSQNAAYFDKENNTFTVYNQTVAPAYKPESTNFFPFNALNENTVSENIRNKLILNGRDKKNWEKHPKKNGDPDLWFGMSMSFDFVMPEGGQIKTANGNKQDMIFEFSGDDDVYVFVDDRLVLQLGGYHEAWTGSINFNTGTVQTTTDKTQQVQSQDLWNNNEKFEDYSTHNFKFFYLERGGDISNCKIKFNLQSIPENSLQIGKNVTTNSTNGDVVDYLKDNLIYKFKVLKVNTSNSYFEHDSIEYEIYPRLQNGQADMSVTPTKATLKNDGFILLKADQVAVFKNIRELGSESFYVQEWLPDDSNGAYENVQWSANGSGGTTITGDNSPEGFTTYNTNDLDNNKSHIVNFNNVLYVNKLSLVQIEKKMANGNSNIEDEFTVLVQMKDQVTGNWTNLPVDTEYKKSGDTNTTYKIDSTSKVTLKAGQTITFESKFVGGTELKVTEQSIDSKFNQNPDYQYQIDNGNLESGSEAKITVPETEKENHSLKFVITNKYEAKVPNKIQIKKVDNNTQKPSPLQGAKFKLYEEVKSEGQPIPGLPNVNVVEVKNGEQPVETKLTGVDGITELDYSLDPTKVYYLIESQTPDGYLVPQYGFKLYYGKEGELYIATVGDDGKFGEGVPAVYTNDLLMATVTIQNIPGKPLPNTGGAGTKLFTFSGAAVIAASGLMYGYKKKSDKRNRKGGLRK